VALVDAALADGGGRASPAGKARALERATS